MDGAFILAVDGKVPNGFATSDSILIEIPPGLHTLVVSYVEVNTGGYRTETYKAKSRCVLRVELEAGKKYALVGYRTEKETSPTGSEPGQTVDVWSAWIVEGSSRLFIERSRSEALAHCQ